MNSYYPYYHIFGNEWDRYSKTLREAKRIYNLKIAEGQEDIRIHKQVSETEEEYIQGQGGFPA